jgi:subtilisin family serine protease
VTLVGSAGNDHVNLAAPTRVDETSPDFPLDSERPRTVKRTCLSLPAEAPHVITVSALGPSTVKAEYSNYGLGSIDLSAPGGYFFDFVGTPRFETARNEVLAPYPLDVAIAEGWVDAGGRPVDEFAVRYCGGGRCGVYVYLEGTSLAAPHVAGVAALIIERHGRATGYGGRALDPAVVTEILESTATDHACPRGGVDIYTDEGAPAEYNAVCRGTRDDNGLYGEGIVDADAAVRSR